MRDSFVVLFVVVCGYLLLNSYLSQNSLSGVVVTCAKTCGDVGVLSVTKEICTCNPKK